MNKVLIIEDDAIAAHVYRLNVEKRGYIAETCSDGPSGLDWAREHSPDAILLDLMLPRMNGLDILKNVREETRFKSLPIIVLTNVYVPNMIQDALSAGASRVFNKATVTPATLLDTLDTLLGRVVEKTIPQNLAPALPLVLEHPGSPPPPCNNGYNPSAVIPPPPGDPLDSAPAQPREKEMTFGEQVHKAFVDANAETLPVMRRLIKGVADTGDPTARERLLVDLFRKVHALIGSASFVGSNDIALVASVLEALLKEMIDQPKIVTDSTQRTVATSVEFIGELFKIARPRSGERAPARILIVDDEMLSRRAIAYALKKAHLVFEGVEADDPLMAVEATREKAFDMIFLDVQMPDMNGFELCSKIRGTSANESTPIIFVTSLSDYTSRAKSTLLGGSDLIAKPFFFVELALKAITILLRSRLDPKRKAA